MIDRLDYIANVDLNDKSAQSLQIAEMTAHFAENVSDFRVIVPSSQAVLARKFRAQSALVLRSLFSGSKNVFTRNLIIGIVLSVFKTNVCVELHQVPSPKYKKLLKSWRWNIKFLFISESLRQLADLPKHYAQFVYHDCVADQNVCNNESIDADRTDRVASYTGAFHKGLDVDSLEPLFPAFQDWQFNLIGADDANLERYAKKFAKYKNVQVLPKIPKKEALEHQRNSSVLLCPLTVENPLHKVTSPLKLFEYIGAGKPIVLSKFGSLKELSPEFDFFCYDDTNGIVEAFQSFLDEDANTLRKKLVSNRQTLLSKFTWQRRIQFILGEIYV